MRNTPITIVPGVIAVACSMLLVACTSPEEKCAALEGTIIKMYNEYVDEISTLTEKQMLATCDQAIEKCPNLAIAHEMKGLLYWDADNLKEALKYYRKALELAPGNEDTLADARLLAFSADGTHVTIGEDGRLTSMPFQNITLAEYARCDSSIRLQWCESALNKRVANKQTKVLVDQHGTVIEKMEFGMKYQINSAVEIDQLLISRAGAAPEKVLHEATFLAVATGAGYGRTN